MLGRRVKKRNKIKGWMRKGRSGRKRRNRKRNCSLYRNTRKVWGERN